MTTELKVRATEYAKNAFQEIVSDPRAYGINEPWDSVNEWIDFELDGDAGDQFSAPEERDAIVEAMWQIGDLETLNKPFGGHPNE